MNSQVFNSDQVRPPEIERRFDLIHVNRMSYATSIGTRSRLCKAGFFPKVDASCPNFQIVPTVSRGKAGTPEACVEIDPGCRLSLLQSPVKSLRYEETAESA
jgi:hypothetical protein